MVLTAASVGSMIASRFAAMSSGVMVSEVVMPAVWMKVRRITLRPPQMKVSPVKGHESCARYATAGETYSLRIWSKAPWNVSGG